MLKKSQLRLSKNQVVVYGVELNMAIHEDQDTNKEIVS